LQPCTQDGLLREKKWNLPNDTTPRHSGAAANIQARESFQLVFEALLATDAAIAAAFAASVQLLPPASSFSAC
jgi:hypothetical protein